MSGGGGEGGREGRKEEGPTEGGALAKFHCGR